MPAHAGMRARRRRWRRQPAPGRGPGPGLGSLLAWFFLNQVSRVWAAPDPNQTRSALLPAPLRIRIACERIRTARQRMSENRCAVGRFGPNSCNSSVRTAATIGIRGRECPSRSAINSAPVSHSQTHLFDTEKGAGAKFP